MSVPFPTPRANDSRVFLAAVRSDASSTSKTPAAHLPRADDPDALDVSYSHNAFEKHRG